MREQSKVLPKEWVERLFSRLQAIYGNRVTTMWADANPQEVQSVWAEGLGGFVGDDLRDALTAMQSAYPDYPPTLPQFSALCRDARERRRQSVQKLPPPKTKAPAEAMRQMRELVAKWRV